MSTIVAPGQTYNLAGLLSAGDMLIGDAGTLGGTAGAIITVDGVATNDGTIDLLAGTSPAAAVGATLEISGTLTNNASIYLAGGAYAGSGAASTGAQLMVTGTLDNAGTITIAAAAVPAGGGDIPGAGATLSDIGVLTNSGLMLIEQNLQYGAGTAGVLSIAGVLNNSGTIELGSGTPRYQYAVSAGAQLDIGVSGTLDNSGALDLLGGSYGYAPVTLVDAGLLLNTGTIAFEHYRGGNFLDVQSGGTLENMNDITITAGNGQLTGPTSPPAGVLLDAGLLDNSGVIDLDAADGNGAFDNFGPTLSVTGRLLNTGTIVLTGGPETIKYDPTGGSGATLANSGVLTNDGAITVGAGAKYYYSGQGFRSGAGVLLDSNRMTNAGTITLYAAFTDRYGPNYGGVLTVTATGVLLNSGTLLTTAAKDIYNGVVPSQAAQILDAGRIDNTGSIYLAGGKVGVFGGTMLITGRLTEAGTISGNGTLTNQGLIAASGDEGRISARTFANDGRVNVKADQQLRIASSVSTDPGDTGTFHIQSDATLTFSAAVAASQAVSLVSQGATLALGDAAAFNAVIDGLRTSTTIDFLKLDVTSASASGTTLAIGVDGVPAFDLTLGAPLAAGSSLGLSSDGHGGTDLAVLHSSG